MGHLSIRSQERIRWVPFQPCWAAPVVWWPPAASWGIFRWSLSPLSTLYFSIKKQRSQELRVCAENFIWFSRRDMVNCNYSRRRNKTTSPRQRHCQQNHLLFQFRMKTIVPWKDANSSFWRILASTVSRLVFHQTFGSDSIRTGTQRVSYGSKHCAKKEPR